jgi:hypothetical protein
MPVIPATQEENVGGLHVQSQPQQKHNYLKNKIKTKRLDVWLQ